MATLPTVGGDIGAWGSELNTWLVVNMNADGTLKIGGGGPGTTSGKILLAPGQSGGVQVGGVVSDNHFWWDGGSGGATTTTLYIGANTGVATEIVMNNGATAEWYIYNSPPSGLANSLRISNAVNDVLVLSQNPVQILLPTYGAGILGLVAGGGVTSYGVWSQNTYPTTLTVTTPGATITGGQASLRYMIIGKTVFINVQCQLIWTGTLSAPITFSLPTGGTSPVVGYQALACVDASNGTVLPGEVLSAGSAVNLLIPNTASTHLIVAGGHYEIS